MLLNYLKLAWRNLFRHRMFSIINLGCLAIGISFALLLGAYIFGEQDVNRQLSRLPQQYLVRSQWKISDLGIPETTLGPLPKALKDEYPGLVANYFRYNPVTNVISAGDRHFKEDIAICDTSLVTMYGFPLLYGNPRQAFINNNSIVITEAAALKYFGRKDAIGERMSMQTTVNNDPQEYTVSAVLKNIPRNSVTHAFGCDYQFFVPTIGNRYYGGGDPAEGWQSVYEVGQVELKPGVRPADLQKPVKALLEKYANARIARNLDVVFEPLSTFHLNENNGAVRRMILILGLVALFILVMAVINYINISIGTASYRLKEIGLRKLFGGLKRQIVFQFLAESFLVSLLAGILSVVIFMLLRPFFSEMLNVQLPDFWDDRGKLVGLVLLLLALISLVAGSYPAFVLGAMKIARAAGGREQLSGQKLGLRKVLLVLQFTLALIVLIGAINVSRQVKYFFQRDLGYSRDQVLIVNALPKRWDSVGFARMETMKKALLNVPQVKEVSLTFEIPERKPPNTLIMQVDGNPQASVNQVSVDEDYAATFGMKVLAGHFLGRGEGPPAPGKAVLNESAVKALGLTAENAVGKTLNIPAWQANFQISAVVADYNYSTMESGIEPICLMNVRDFQSYRYFAIKLAAPGMRQAIQRLESEWKRISPTAPFEYFLMDDKFRSLYDSELRLEKAADLATILNLLIVFTGIFGVVAITLARRNREIAVRKVLGADVKGILILLTREYGMLFLLANLLAWPISYLLSENWLQRYAYRIDQQWGWYLAAALSVFLTAILFIIGQSYRTAIDNPVKHLRSE